MTLGEKILKLRKSKGLSQEQLAGALNVSRQALSKWELGESTPELDKIILLSDYFGVTTDYLLKGGAAEQSGTVPITQEKRSIGLIPLIAVTAVIFIGMMLAATRANDGTLPIYWPLYRALPGIVLQVVGVAIFEIVYYVKRLPVRFKNLFWAINIWMVAAMPVLFITGAVFRFCLTSWDILRYIQTAGAVYLLLCGIVTGLAVWRQRRSRQ